MTDPTPDSQPDSTTTDDLLLLSCYSTTGDTEAFQVLVDRYHKLVWSACWRVLGNVSDTEDAVQNVFLKLAKDAVKVESNLAAWLHTTAFNLSVSLIRSEVTRRKHEHQSVSDPISVNEEQAWRELRELIDVCLSELKEDDRELVVQRFYCGLSQQEIGKRLGISQQQVSNRLKKSVQQLRRSLKNRGLSVSGAVLAATLKAGLAEASVPAQLTASIAKIGIAGIGISKASTAIGTLTVTKAAIASVPVMLVLIAGWFTWGNNDLVIGSVYNQLNKVRSIQYTKTRTNYNHAKTVTIDSSIERYQVLDGYLERVEQFDNNGDIISAMIANYRTGEVVRLDMRSKTYTNNVKLKRQLVVAPDPSREGEQYQLAPQAEFANYLTYFSNDTMEQLATQKQDGRTVLGCSAETTKRQSVWRRTIYVDQETMLPCRTRVTFDNADPITGASVWVRDDFVFDVEIPLSLFSTEPPPGYTLRNAQNTSGIPLP